MIKIIGIYKITSPSGKVYIGQSIDIKKRIRQKQSGKNNGMYGKKHSEETKEKIRQKALGRKASDQARLNMSKSHKNRIVSDETRIKISIANSGSNHHQYGRKVSEETKRKISQTLIKNNLSKQKKVIDLKTGIIYNSYKELAEEIGVKHSTLKTWLSGKVSKITNYKYIEND